jgi:uncharacterized phiE125 gp8 family phage protein
MKHITTTPPATEPVSLAEMRLHLGIGQIDDTVRDLVITSRIVAAREFVESFINRRLITQTVTAVCGAYDERWINNNPINLLAPLQSVTEIRYTNSGGVLTVMPSVDYLAGSYTAAVMPEYGKAWPEARDRLDAVQIAYVCGYGNAADVPQGIKEAIMFIVSQWEVFQSSIEGVVRPFTIPNAAKELLTPFIDYRGGL